MSAFIALAKAGIPTFVVTNQGGVGRGFLTPRSLEDIHNRMAALIRDAGGRLDSIIHCPHAPSAGCLCRKPRPGMLYTLADRFSVQLEASTFIGDNVTDLEAGSAAGCATVLVGTGEGRRSAERLGLQNVRWGDAASLLCTEMPGLAATAPDLNAAVLHVISIYKGR
jgi:D-glycero-D-manno-heptose 1,7-bisphosphate phosphatase